MDVPKHALRPTLLSALERIEALKEARKVDGEKIEMAIKELKESAKREQTLKNEIERLLEVERALKNLHAELKKTQKRHVVMGQRIKELEEQNNRLRSGTSTELVTQPVEEEASNQLVVRESHEQLSSLTRTVEALSEEQRKERDRGDALVQTVLELHDKHNALVHIMQQSQSEKHDRIQTVLSGMLGAAEVDTMREKEVPAHALEAPQTPPSSGPPASTGHVRIHRSGSVTVDHEQKSTSASPSPIVNMKKGILLLDFTVRPDQEHGLCCKLDSGFIVSGFRDLPSGAKGPMESVGIRTGDRMVAINKVDIDHETPVHKVMSHLKGQRILHIKVERHIHPKTPSMPTSTPLERHRDRCLVFWLRYGRIIDWCPAVSWREWRRPACGDHQSSGNADATTN